MYSHDLPLDAFDLPPEAVRARFAWAERQGLPRWLWPDVAPRDWSAALERIEAVLRARLSGDAPAPLLDGDPDAFEVAAYTSGTGPLLGVWLEQGRIAASAAIAPMLAYHLRHNRLRMQRLAALAATLCDTLDEAGVAATLVKGMHTAAVYFPEPGARPAADVDLVIAPDRICDAGAVLRRAGLVPGEIVIGPPRQQQWHPIPLEMLPRTLRFVHAADPWSVDLQTSFDRRFASGGAVVRMDEAVHAAGAARVLPQPWLFLYLATHASNGFENLTLLRLTELALVARRDAAAGLLDWSAFIATAERAGALGLIYPALHLCEALAPGTIPAQVRRCSRAAAPKSAWQFIESLCPATAHRLLPPSRAEKFLWSPTRRARAAQVFREIVPREAGLFRIYRRRAWKLVRGTMFP